MVNRSITADFSSLHTFHTPKFNLPIQVTSFVGRERDIASVKRLLDAARLVTLTGAGGAGKTRLALRVATEEIKDFDDGIWFVELAPLSNPALLTQTVANTLHVRQQPERSLLDTLLDFLGPQNILLLLDSCEHLIEASARFAEAILHSCPAVKILATSREPLNIPGDTPYRVPSLSLPDPHAAPSIDSLTRSDAVRLFVERAVLIQPTFHITDENADALAQICNRLDGIPLALELAAARINVLSVQEIATRLDDRFRLLTAGERTAPPRHQTLRAAIDWSYSLLTNAEQTLLRRLAVFAGSWSLEAAEQVASDGDFIRREDVLDLLARLIDKSLVSSKTRDDTTRYQMRETIRHYAHKKLAQSGEDMDTHHRYLQFFVRFAEQADAQIEGQDQVSVIKRLELEYDNLRAALDWSQTAQDDSDASLRLAGALTTFWGIRGYFQEGHEYLMTALARTRADHTAARAKGLGSAGYLSYMQGDYPAARELMDASLASYRQLGTESRGALARILILRGYLESEVGKYATAAALILQGLDIMRELNDGLGTARALRELGGCAIRAGEYAQATRYLEEALLLFQEVGDPQGKAIVLSGLAEIALRQGNYEYATAQEQENLQVRRAVGDHWGIAVSLGNLAWVGLQRGDLERASALLQESVMLRRELGDPGSIAWCLEKSARIALLRAQTKSARLRRLNLKRAVRLFGAAAALRAPGGSVIDLIDQPEYEQHLARLRGQFREATFDRLWAQGEALTLDEAIDLAFPARQPDTAVEQAGSSAASPGARKFEPGGLTARQTQVAELVAQGKSNKSIAGELGVSERTVENHIANIMSKLGFSSRTQIGVWTAEHGLTRTAHPA